MNVYTKFEELKLVPVVAIENVDDAIPLASVIKKVGLPLIEITFRTKAAAKSISLIKENFPEMLIGAGTVLTIDQVKEAWDAGSMFIVTPGFNPTIVDYCIENSIPIIPGLNAPTFVEWGLERGLSHFKFYPADVSGGAKMLKFLSGPYPKAKFMPTGGINNSNLIEYLKLENVFACGGSWIVKKDLISFHNFDEIKHRVKEALKLIESRIS
jgi:2-dehydro-3-deoxyphosphogluconate aldolase / (4S)-4-hydroxy-2-oxoglutarate aldolase